MQTECSACGRILDGKNNVITGRYICCEKCHRATPIGANKSSKEAKIMAKEATKKKVSNDVVVKKTEDTTAEKKSSRSKMDKEKREEAIKKVTVFMKNELKLSEEEIACVTSNIYMTIRRKK